VSFLFRPCPSQGGGRPDEQARILQHSRPEAARSGRHAASARSDRGTMARRHQLGSRQWKVQRRRAATAPPRSRRSFGHGKRARGWERSQTPFLPPEDWHEPGGGELTPRYRIITQEPGEGYYHPVTAADVHDRLAALPPRMLQPLEVVQLSRMTRKKKTVPCYGMQWGNSLYLYPIEESLIEYFVRPPLEAERRESTMYGGRWQQTRDGLWRLIWTAQTIRDFYLNGILLHELGHLLDDRNRSYGDRERYADWFAIQYGYRASGGLVARDRAGQRSARRHAGL
jgi:hypothetical protein